MSVINKMLRDLDARRAATALPGREVPAGLTRDTASVKGGPAMLRVGVPLGRMVLLVVLLVLGGMAAWWYFGQTPDLPLMSAKPPQATGPAPSALSAPVAGPVAVASSAAAATTTQAAAPLGSQHLNQMLDQAAASPQAAPRLVPPLPAASAPVSPEQAQQMVQQTLRNTPSGQLGLPAQSPGLAYELQQQLAKPAPRPAATPAPVVPSNPPLTSATASRAAAPVPARSPTAGSDTAALAVRPAPLRKDRPSDDVASAASAVAVPQVNEVPVSKQSAAASKSASLPRPTKPGDVVPPVNPKLATAQEAVAQARSLWNTGSREAALEAMRQAVAVAERAQTSTPDPAALPAFQTLVRELARMELALGQVSQLLDQLVRFEPLLADQADLWAVRGNAAQRLGQHQESVHAYGMALKLRPGEPRWMLASAVSLALQGQLAAAAEQAEKARAAGPVSPEVLTYLRQLGVSLR